MKNTRFALYTFLVVYLLFQSCFSPQPALIRGKNYTLTPFSRSVRFKDAAIEAIAYENGKMKYTLSGTSFQLGEQTTDTPLKMCANSVQGQHIHVIVDNKPYDAKYEAEFDYEIADGDHFLLTFLSRSYHESIKTPRARKAWKIQVKNKRIVKADDIASLPMLFYSRPKGNYVGVSETQKVMLDFYPVNASISDKAYRIKAEINGETFVLNKWQPYYIEGLPMGENKIKLTLIDAQDKTVDTPLNPVERTFVLKEDPAAKG